MKTTAELPVAESVKLCIKLDEETKERWKDARKDLEGVVKYVHGKPIPITDIIVFQCLLYCYEKGDEWPIFFAERFLSR